MRWSKLNVHVTAMFLVRTASFLGAVGLTPGGCCPFVLVYAADRKRPWITAEKTRFIELLKTAECRISPREVAYFSGQPGTLKQHFDIIAAMQPRAEAAN